MAKHIGSYIFIGFFTIFGIFLITVSLVVISTEESGLGLIAGWGGLSFGILCLIGAIIMTIYVIWMKKRSQSLEPEE